MQPYIGYVRAPHISTEAFCENQLAVWLERPVKSIIYFVIYKLFAVHAFMSVQFIINVCACFHTYVFSQGVGC